MTQRRSILVTGCSSGIGAWCADALARDGWLVFSTARKPADIAALQAKGLEALYLDYREPESIAECAAAVLDATGGTLDALFNNGAYSQPGAVEDLPMAALREQFEANFFGWHDLTRQIIPAMRAQGHGRIVNCSSILGLTPMRWRGAYVSSKFALEGLTLSMRMELEGSGIHVSLIEPGGIPSKIAINALTYAEKYIDLENSVHRDDYAIRIAQLRSGGTPEKPGNGPELVWRVLKHALESNNPKPHYVVVREAKLAAFARRIVPSGLWYRILRKAS